MQQHFITFSSIACFISDSTIIEIGSGTKTSGHLFRAPGGGGRSGIAVVVLLDAEEEEVSDLLVDAPGLPPGIVILKVCPSFNE
jgi:hypothetical protein